MCPESPAREASPRDVRNRTIRLQRLAIAGLGGLLLLVIAGGQAGQPASGGAAPATPQYLAGGDRIYRLYPDGRIEYILVDFRGAANGVPGWALLHIDDSLTRDRMGNVLRRRRN